MGKTELRGLDEDDDEDDTAAGAAQSPHASPSSSAAGGGCSSLFSATQKLVPTCNAPETLEIFKQFFDAAHKLNKVAVGVYGNISGATVYQQKRTAEGAVLLTQITTESDLRVKVAAADSEAKHEAQKRTEELVALQKDIERLETQLEQAIGDENEYQTLAMELARMLMLKGRHKERIKQLTNPRKISLPYSTKRMWKSMELKIYPQAEAKTQENDEVVVPEGTDEKVVVLSVTGAIGRNPQFRMFNTQLFGLVYDKLRSMWDLRPADKLFLKRGNFVLGRDEKPKDYNIEEAEAIVAVIERDGEAEEVQLANHVHIAPPAPPPL
eukprot:gb/GEZN01008233.1/.p1 GENE.gb/GEZN01008233.1/~~gb/GEZN01008233.1/.p1  ORF type:complete len:325 (+),score=68.46 gb/GEZN01008233.1/:396-1370(+)